MWGRLKVTLHSPIKQVATDWRGRKLFIKAWILQHLNSSLSSHVCSKKCNFDAYYHICLWSLLTYIDLTILPCSITCTYMRKVVCIWNNSWHSYPLGFWIHLFKIFSTPDPAASPSHLLELRNLNLCGTDATFWPPSGFFSRSLHFLHATTNTFFLDLFSNTFIFQLLNLISMMLRRGEGRFLLSG